MPLTPPIVAHTVSALSFELALFECLQHRQKHAVGLFTTAEGVTRSNQLAAEWIAKACPDLVPGPPEITEGPVTVR